MDTKTIIKYAALAIGAYLIYNWMTTPAAGTTLPPSPAPPPQPNTQPPANTPPPTTTTAATQTPGMATEADFTKWATDYTAAQAAPRDKVLTFDEWNYYRGDKGGRPIVDALLVNGISSANRSTMKIDAPTYWTLMRQVNSGMTGMGMGLIAPQFSWLQ